MKRLSRVLIIVFSLGLFILPAGPQAFAEPLSAEEPEISESVTAGAILWQVDAEYERLVLTVGGPGDLVQTLEYPAGAKAALPVDSLSDGIYTYELTVIPRGSAADPQAGANGRQATGDAGTVAPPLVQSGYFTVSGSQFVIPELEEAGDSLQAADVAAPAAPDDISHNDDVIIDGSLNVGIDSVLNRNFGFDTVILSENNLRVLFEDTSNSASFPSNDWRLVANDSSNGGANKFSIEDATGNRTPFTIRAGAPSNSLYVDGSGRLGLGTSTPTVNAHIVTGNTPTVRLQQDGSSGFTPQTWDVAGNEANFFIRDVTNGSTLPIRLRPGAPTSSIDIAASGNVGFGTASPASSMHIRRTNGTAQLLVEEANGTTDFRTIAKFENNGPPLVAFVNASIGVGGAEWTNGVLPFGTNSSYFIITRSGTGAAELRLFEDGSLTILGTLTTAAGGTCAGGCAAAAQAVNGQTVLASLANVPVESWAEAGSVDVLDEQGNIVDQREITVRHLSPVTTDFNAAFNTGLEGNQIAPLDVATVALVATQELQTEIGQLRNQISDLQQVNAELNARLVAIEKALDIQVNTEVKDKVAEEEISVEASSVFLPNVNH